MACKIIAAALLCGATLAHADLQPRDINGDGVVDAFYDNAQDLSFAADADLSTTLGFFYIPGVSGLPRGQAIGWPTTLDLYGVTGWRAPRPLSIACQPDGDDPTVMFFCNVDRSELSELPTFDVFRNVLPFYWLDGLLPQTAGNGSRVNPYFEPADRFHSATDEVLVPGGAWAVHDGDIAAAVPEPETWALMVAGLMALRFASARRARRPT